MFEFLKRDKKKGKCFILNDKIFVTEKDRKKKGIKTILLYGDEDLDLRNVFAQNIKDFGLGSNTICFSKDKRVYEDVFEYARSCNTCINNIDFRGDVIRFSPFDQLYAATIESKYSAYDIILDEFASYLKTKPDVYSDDDIEIISALMKNTFDYMLKKYRFSYAFNYMTFVYFFKETFDKYKDLGEYENIINVFIKDVLEKLVEKSDEKACAKSDVGVMRGLSSFDFPIFPLCIEPPQFCIYPGEDTKNLVKMTYNIFMGFFHLYNDEDHYGARNGKDYYGINADESYRKNSDSFRDYVIYLDDFQDYAFDLSDLTVGFRTKLIVVAIKLKEGENIEDYKKKYSIKPDLEYKL